MTEDREGSIANMKAAAEKSPHVSCNHFLIVANDSGIYIFVISRCQPLKEHMSIPEGLMKSEKALKLNQGNGVRPQFKDLDLA